MDIRNNSCNSNRKLGIAMLTEEEKMKLLDKRISQAVLERRSSRDIDEIDALGLIINTLVDLYESEITSWTLDREELLWYDQSWIEA
jgi:hypothetical protein